MKAVNTTFSKENKKKNRILKSLCKVEVGTGYLRGMQKHHSHEHKWK